MANPAKLLPQDVAGGGEEGRATASIAWKKVHSIGDMADVEIHCSLADVELSWKQSRQSPGSVP